jgi:ELWxxDGT repeat protein
LEDRCLPSVTINEFAVPSVSASPAGMTVGPDGNLWFTESSGKIGRMTTTGVLSEFSLPSNAPNAAIEPGAITVGPDGNLWFTEDVPGVGAAIGRITPTGVVTEFAVPGTGPADLRGITAGPDGNIWFTQYHLDLGSGHITSNMIGKITPTGVITQFAVPTPSSGPFEITAGPDGNLWFTELTANKIGRITPAGVFSEFAVPANEPLGIAVGPDGNLWFTDNFGNEIGKITPTGAVSEFPLPTGNSPNGITAGPDGNLWFTELFGNNVGECTPTGTVNEFSLSAPQSFPVAITAGPDGNIWFTEEGTSRIGQVVLPGPTLVRDINTNTADSSPTNLVDVNGMLFFTALDNAGNIGLYKNDPANGVTLVKEFGPPDGTGGPLFNLTNLNGTLFFKVTTTGGSALWKSDGTAAGTVLVQEFTGGTILDSGLAGTSLFVPFNNDVYFLVQAPGSLQLWKSDGTITSRVDQPAVFTLASSAQLTVANGVLFFVASAAGDPANVTELWKTDGTSTQRADPNFSAQRINGLTNVNGALYFFALDPGGQAIDLYQTNGSGMNTTLIQSGFSVFSEGLTAAVGNKLFFSASTPANPFNGDLWVSDGTTTTRLTFTGLRPSHLLSVNGRLVFDVGFINVWVSDGTIAGTSLLVPNFVVLLPSQVAIANNTLFLGVEGGDGSQQVWQTDGTSAGTMLIMDIPPGLFSSSPPSHLTFSNGTLFFAATDGTHGEELWQSNLTAAGTQMVADIDTDTLGSFPNQLINANGTLFFTASQAAFPSPFNPGPEIWRSDGTSAGTQLLGTPFSNGATPTELTSVSNGTVFFTDGNALLWQTDGTAGGTKQVLDFSTLGAGGLSNLTAAGNLLFFTVFASSGNEQLWRSDGTAAGTILVQDNVLVPIGSGIGVNGIFYFVNVDQITFNSQLWKSDGTTAEFVDPVNPGTNVNGLINVNGTLFYFDNSASFNAETLWKTDGTTATLLAGIHTGDFVSVSNVVAGNGTLYFAVSDSTTGSNELWSSNGTPGGTGAFATVAPDFGNVAFAGNQLFFTVNDPVQGEQLWASDGTQAGTHSVLNIAATNLTASNGKLLFTASDGTHGEQLWESDGTTTVEITQVNFPAFANPSTLTDVNGRLFLTANDGFHGTELWTLGNGPTVSNTLSQVTSAATAANLQSLINALPASADITIHIAGSQASTQLTNDVNAVNSLAAQSTPVTIVLDYSNATGTVSDVMASPPANVTLVLKGNGSTSTIVGTSPALTVAGQGKVEVDSFTLTTATNSPTILLISGSLTLRNDSVQESTGFTQAAIAVTGGTLDLGTASNPGGNVIDVNGSGEFVHNSTPNNVSAVGDTFEINDSATSATILSFTKLVSSVNPSILGQPVTFTATVRSNQVGSARPTGQVDFQDVTSGRDLGRVFLVNGVASLTVANLPVNLQQIVASYMGNAASLPSLDSLTQAVHYQFSFLAPLKPNGKYNLGQNISIQFLLTDFYGNPITSLSAVQSIQVQQVTASGQPGNAFTPASPGNSGLANNGTNYIFHWQTKGLTAGFYHIVVTLNDGTVQTIEVQLA